MYPFQKDKVAAVYLRGYGEDQTTQWGPPARVLQAMGPHKNHLPITIPLTTSIKFFYTNNALFQIHFPPKSNTKIS